MVNSGHRWMGRRFLFFFRLQSPMVIHREFASQMRKEDSILQFGVAHYIRVGRHFQIQHPRDLTSLQRRQSNKISRRFVENVLIASRRFGTIIARVFLPKVLSSTPFASFEALVIAVCVEIRP
jgi:hypothetical protein